MTETIRLERRLQTLWTGDDLRRLFGVTLMTIYNWQHRPSPRRDALPMLRIPGNERDAVRYVPEDVMSWARRNNIPMRMSTFEQRIVDSRPLQPDQQVA